MFARPTTKPLARDTKDAIWPMAILGHERNSPGDPNATISRITQVTWLMSKETVNSERAIANPFFHRLVRCQARVLSLRLNELRIISSGSNTTNGGQARTDSKLQGTKLQHDLERRAIDVMGEFEFIQQ